MPITEPYLVISKYLRDRTHQLSSRQTQAQFESNRAFIRENRAGDLEILVDQEKLFIWRNLADHDWIIYIHQDLVL